MFKVKKNMFLPEVLYMYSGPSLSGHTQQRPPSLMRPQIVAAPTINVFTSPSHQRPPLECGHNFLANRVALSQRDYCICQIVHN